MLAEKNEYLQEAAETMFRLTAEEQIRKRCRDRTERKAGDIYSAHMVRPVFPAPAARILSTARKDHCPVLAGC